MALYINGNKTGCGGGGNSNMRELTQAEYDALTTEEKNNGTVYYITDGDDNNDGYQLIQPIIYSEEEREVGVWTDGKPLYQKTYEVDNVGVSNLTVDSNMSLLDIKIVGFINNGIKMNNPYSGEVFQIAPSGTAILRVWNDESNGLRCNLEGGSSTQTCTARFTIQYTKTTDVSGSGKWTPQGTPSVHYSTEEQVVGTWVDGSTLYEKTIEFGYLPNTATKTISHGITNVDMIFATEAFMINPTTGYSTYLNMTNETISSQVQYAVNRNDIEVWAGLNRSEWMGYITVRYTKTTT